MFLDHNPDVNIPSHNAWLLVTHAMEDIHMLIGTSGLDCHLELGFLVQHFFSVAFFAFILLIDHDPLSHAVTARLGRLLVHSRAQHLHLDDHSLSLTGAALSLVGSALAFTAVTELFSAMGHLDEFAIEDIF